jgi:rhamnogalacturonyl hydrolase YesR
LLVAHLQDSHTPLYYHRLQTPQWERPFRKDEKHRKGRQGLDWV